MLRPKEGYPDSFGAKRASVFPVAGPASYAQYTAPTTGGQDVQVSGPSGLKMVDYVMGGISGSGLYRAEVVHIEASTLNGVPVADSKIVLKWYVVSTGAQVTGAVNLSAEIVYLFALGQK